MQSISRFHINYFSDVTVSSKLYASILIPLEKDFHSAAAAAAAAAADCTIFNHRA